MGFPFAEKLEASWREIYQEYLGIEDLLEPWVEAKLHDGGWRTYGIFGFPHGEAIPEAVERCPFTASLVEEHIPTHGAVGFSVLAPQTQIRPHEGYQGDFLRCHLGLRVPEGDCGLRVAGATQRWHDGRVLVFDDRNWHDAWNLTEHERVLLLIDFLP